MLNMHPFLDRRTDVWGRPSVSFPGKRTVALETSSWGQRSTLFSFIQNLQIGLKCQLMLASAMLASAIKAKRNLPAVTKL